MARFDATSIQRKLPWLSLLKRKRGEIKKCFVVTEHGVVTATHFVETESSTEPFKCGEKEKKTTVSNFDRR